MQSVLVAAAMPRQLDVEEMPKAFHSDSWMFAHELKGLAYLATTWRICSEVLLPRQVSLHDNPCVPHQKGSALGWHCSHVKSANAATTATTLLRASVSVNHRAVSNSAKDGYISEKPWEASKVVGVKLKCNGIHTVAYHSISTLLSFLGSFLREENS